MRRNRDFNQRQTTSSGPLLTNHLRDLDMELELLKRKRDIIQKEQEMLNRYSTKRQYDYEQSSNRYDQQEPDNYQFNTNNFSARYDGPSTSGNFTRPQAPKRQTSNQYWQNPSNNKNFKAPETINPWQNSMPKQNTGFSNPKKFQSQQPSNISTQIRPLMNIRPMVGQRAQRNFPNQRNFKNAKISKPKPHQAPNKLATYPVKEAKKLVSQTLEHGEKKIEFNQILRADKTPSLQMKGRLELALGAIIKEVKNDHCTDPKDLEYFQSPFIQRLLKHTIRTRIRQVMIDQVVGNFTEIVANYRKKYPKETDIELVQVAKNAQTLSSKTIGVPQLIESDDPEQFYKKNMMRVLSKKLDEMFGNLEKLYMKKESKIEEYIQNMPDPKKSNDQEQIQGASSDSGHTGKDTEKIRIENIIGDGDVTVANEKINKVKFYSEFMDEIIEFRLPKVLPKFKDMLLSIILTDSEFLGTKAIITNKIRKSFLRTSGNDSKLPKPTVLTSPIKSTTPKPNATATALSESDTSSVSETKAREPPETSLVVESLATNATTSNKKSETEALFKIPSIDSPIDSSEETAIAIPPGNITTVEKMVAEPKTPVSADLLFVKLISRPVLPARAVIYDFLNKFNPVSIKKHKSVSNLLVIGFKNIEDYNKILEVNESVIGDCTIIIKASEQVNKAKAPISSPGETNENATKDGDQSLVDSSLLNVELENQITDLLSSIRKAEENMSDTDTDDIKAKMDRSEITNIKKEESKSSDDVESNKTTEGELDKTFILDNIDNTCENKKYNESFTESKNFQETKSDLKANGTNDTDIAADSDKSEKEENKERETTSKSETEENKEMETTNIPETEENKELETITESTEINLSETNNESIKPAGDKLKEGLKETGRATPTRSSTRLANATPCTIRTRRTSRLAQNN